MSGSMRCSTWREGGPSVNHRPAVPPRAILVIQLGDIGDVALTLPGLQALRAAFPGAAIAMVVRKKAVELARCCPFLDESFAVPQGVSWTEQLDFFRNLRRRRFDWAIDLRTGTRGAFLAFLSGAPNRLAFRETGERLRNALFNRLVTPDTIPHQHILDYQQRLFAALGCPPPDSCARLLDPAAFRPAVDRLLAEAGVHASERLVAFQPFSLWAYKEWGVERFRELAARVRSRWPVRIAVCGAEADRPGASQIVGGTDGINLAGQTTLGMYAALLARCELLVSVDSSGPHLAAAVGTPTVTIYGPTSPRTWAPRGGRHTVVQPQEGCVPCLTTGCEGSGKSRCLDELPVEKVLAAVAARLDEGGKKG